MQVISGKYMSQMSFNILNLCKEAFCPPGINFLQLTIMHS